METRFFKREGNTLDFMSGSVGMTCLDNKFCGVNVNVDCNNSDMVKNSKSGWGCSRSPIDSKDLQEERMMLMNSYKQNIADGYQGNLVTGMPSPWNQGSLTTKNNMDNISLDKLSPTGVTGSSVGCHSFEDLVNKILDEDITSQRANDHREFLDEASKQGRLLRSSNMEKCMWSSEGRRTIVGQQNFLEPSKAFQGQGRNGFCLPQTHSASDLFNASVNEHSWKQKSSSDHFIPDFSILKNLGLGEEMVSGNNRTESKEVYGQNNNLLVTENYNKFIMGGCINSSVVASSFDRSNHIPMFSLGTKNDHGQFMAEGQSLDQQTLNNMMAYNALQKCEAGNWFLPLGSDVRHPVTSYLTGDGSDASKNSQIVMPGTDRMVGWQNKDELYLHGKDPKKIMDSSTSSSGPQYTANGVRPLLKKSVYDGEMKSELMPIMGGSFVSSDYIHPEAAMYPSPSVARFVPLALLDHTRSGYPQMKMTPLFVKQAQDCIASQQAKNILNKGLTAPTTLDHNLEQCFEQLNNLEKEGLKVDSELCKLKIPAVSSGGIQMNFPRFSHNSTRVNHLVAESLKQHTEINLMLMKIKKISSHPLHANIYSAMDTWLEGIRKVQARRKEEIVSSANRNNSSCSRYQEEKDNSALSSAVEELLRQTRRVRTALWCAFQMCLFACSSPNEKKDPIMISHNFDE